MPYAENIEPVPVTVQTAAGTGSAVDLGSLRTASLWLEVDAASGTTPSLTVTVEHSRDGTRWRTLGSFSAVNSVSVTPKAFPGSDRYLRVSWAITGAGASFTFRVAGQKVFVLATPDDVRKLALSSRGLADLTDEAIDSVLQGATDYAITKIRARFTPPFTEWGADLRRCVSNIAAYDLMSVRGQAPEPGARDTFKDRFDQQDAWLDEIRDGTSTPIGVVDATAGTTDEIDFVISDDRRGW